MSATQVITRFAPSPTGFMHVGGVRTAIFAYLWAKRNNGKFILRIEDTDKEREVDGSIEHIIESLQWLGVSWDEGPIVGGQHAPYIQSQRLDIYKKYASILIERGYAYPDPYTTEEIESFRKKAEEEKKPFLYREYRPEIFDSWDGTKPLRFRIPEIKTTTWNDVVFGNLSAGPEALDDFILIKSDGYPTYNFAHIVDDIEMGVTLVCRGQEFISSTPKFLSVYQALNITPPSFASLPHIMAEGGNKKLGKRDGAKDILEYRDEGYLPEALFNFLTFLGWNPGTNDEILSKEELVTIFDISKIQKAGAQFNDEKLDWLNREYLKKYSKEELVSYFSKGIPEEIKSSTACTPLLIEKLAPVLLERISKNSDLDKMYKEGELLYFFQQPIDYAISNIIWKTGTKEETVTHLNTVSEILSTAPEDIFDTPDKIKNLLWEYAEKFGRGNVLWPLRYTLSGKEKSPDPFTLVYILGKEESISRIIYAKNLLQAI